MFLVTKKDSENKKLPSKWTPFASLVFSLLHSIFSKQLGSGLSPQNYLYFQGFWGSKLFNGCLVV